jgi:septal ring factor EnvC (AmiA/AmiB activator)
LCKIVHFFCPILSFFEESVHLIKQKYKEEIKLANEEITKLDKQLLEKNAKRKQIKREELRKFERKIASIKKYLAKARTHLNNVKDGEGSADKEMNRLFKKREYWTKKMKLILFLLCISVLFRLPLVLYS